MGTIPLESCTENSHEVECKLFVFISGGDVGSECLEIVEQACVAWPVRGLPCATCPCDSGLCDSRFLFTGQRHPASAGRRLLCKRPARDKCTWMHPRGSSATCRAPTLRSQKYRFGEQGIRAGAWVGLQWFLWSTTPPLINTGARTTMSVSRTRVPSPLRPRPESEEPP